MFQSSIVLALRETKVFLQKVKPVILARDVIKFIKFRFRSHKTYLVFSLNSMKSKIVHS